MREEWNQELLDSIGVTGKGQGAWELVTSDTESTYVTLKSFSYLR